MKNWFRNKIRQWLFPEYVEVVSFMGEVREAMDQKMDGKTIKVDRPIVLVGNMANCRVEVKPKLYPKIVLSHIGLESLLGLSGNQHFVSSCYFSGSGEEKDLDIDWTKIHFKKQSTFHKEAKH